MRRTYTMDELCDPAVRAELMERLSISHATDVADAFGTPVTSVAGPDSVTLRCVQPPATYVASEPDWHASRGDAA